MRGTLDRSTRSMPTDYLARIEAKLDALLKDKRASARAEKLCAMAYAKMQTTGENALPMRTAEVAIVLGVKTASVHQFVFTGRLKQRWDGGRFHPSDVREYLERARA